MSGIYISYRRQDATSHAGRLHSDLARRYGDDRVIIDRNDLVPSFDWMLVVIGPQWISATDAAGRRRLDDPQDFVRSEVAAALRQDKRVVPVLVGGANMPIHSDLPDDVDGLSMRQCVELLDTQWGDGMAELFQALDPMMGKSGWQAHCDRATKHPQVERMTPVMGRIAQAFDSLRGRVPRNADPPRPTPVSAATPTASASPSLVWVAGAAVSQPAAQRTIDVFVSYATKDRGFVDEVVRALESQRRRCWIAHRDIQPGVPSWSEPIVAAIANSRLVLVLLTAHSMVSEQVLREVTLADNKKIPLLPVILDDTTLSDGLSYFFVAGQRLDLTRSSPVEQVRSIVPAVARRLPSSA